MTVLRVALGVLLGLVVLGLVLKLLPLLMLAAMVLGAVYTVKLVKRQGRQLRPSRVPEGQTAREAASYRSAREYWLAQANNPEASPTARKVAQDLVAFNNERLRDLGTY